MKSKEQGNFVHTKVQMKLTKGAKVIITDSCLPFLTTLILHQKYLGVSFFFVCLFATFH